VVGGGGRWRWGGAEGRDRGSEGFEDNNFSEEGSTCFRGDVWNIVLWESMIKVPRNTRKFGGYGYADASIPSPHY
jgi:hypothetical protein